MIRKITIIFRWPGPTRDRFLVTEREQVALSDYPETLTALDTGTGGRVDCDGYLMRSRLSSARI
jgi:hypothetical protein